MKINLVSNVNFQNHVPVEIWAKDQYQRKYRRVYYSRDNNYLKRCQRQVISNLNGTLKELNKEFIELYKKSDKDYSATPVARSFYTGNSGIYLITGHDVDNIDLGSKKIGKAKAESIAVNGTADSDYTKQVISEYYRELGKYLKTSSSRLKNEYNEPLILRVYFNAERDKKGNVKKFTLDGARFLADKA